MRGKRRCLLFIISVQFIHGREISFAYSNYDDRHGELGGSY